MKGQRRTLESGAMTEQAAAKRRRIEEKKPVLPEPAQSAVETFTARALPLVRRLRGIPPGALTSLDVVEIPASSDGDKFCHLLLADAVQRATLGPSVGFLSECFEMAVEHEDWEEGEEDEEDEEKEQEEEEEGKRSKKDKKQPQRTAFKLTELSFLQPLHREYEQLGEDEGFLLPSEARRQLRRLGSVAHLDKVAEALSQMAEAVRSPGDRFHLWDPTAQELLDAVRWEDLLKEDPKQPSVESLVRVVAYTRVYHCVTMTGVDYDSWKQYENWLDAMCTALPWVGAYLC